MLQLSPDVLVACIPLLVKYLASQSVVVHSYAANTVERIFTVKTPEGKPA